MRITMICIGSMGDVRPYLVLGRELKRRGHDIAICAFSDFEETVLKEGMRFKPIPGNAKGFIAEIMNGTNGFLFIKQVVESLSACVDPFLKGLEEGCADAEAIISTYFGEVTMSIAEVLHVPFIQTHYFPMDKNAVAPISSAPGQHVGKAWNLASYQLGYAVISLIEMYFLTEWRQKHGMSPRKLEINQKYQLNGHTIPVLYAMSPLVLPRPTTWGENIHMTGYWLDNRTADYEPEPGLIEFLEAEPTPPIYIGFGSMANEDMKETLDIVLAALNRTGLRAVLARGWGNVTEVHQKNAYLAGFVPHDWLFKRVSAVVHHGGAGTLAAGILAGNPTLVIPFGGDQPFWGARAQALGIGPRPIPRDQLTVARLSRALTDLTQTKKYRVAARELGQRLRTENGAMVAADLIEHELRKWLRQEGMDPSQVPKNENP